MSRAKYEVEMTQMVFYRAVVVADDEDDALEKGQELFDDTEHEKYIVEEKTKRLHVEWYDDVDDEE